MVMLQAGDPEHGSFSKATESQIKQDRDLQDISMFLYRLESDFEDKRMRLEKMLRGFNPPVSCADLFSFIPSSRLHPADSTLNRHERMKNDPSITAIPPSFHNITNPLRHHVIGSCSLCTRPSFVCKVSSSSSYGSLPDSPRHASNSSIFNQTNCIENNSPRPPVGHILASMPAWFEY